MTMMRATMTSLTSPLLTTSHYRVAAAAAVADGFDCGDDYNDDYDYSTSDGDDEDYDDDDEDYVAAPSLTALNSDCIWGENMI